MAMNQQDIDETCVFCLIISGQDKETTIIKKNKDLVCFRDIDPAAPHHYLVVPKQHIISCHSLHSGNISLVKQMAEMGKEVLQEEGFTDPEDIRLGFHQPPFTSIDHLHLHVLAPTREISISSAFKFIPGGYRFLTEKCLINLLKHKAPPITDTDSCILSI